MQGKCDLINKINNGTMWKIWMLLKSGLIFYMQSISCIFLSWFWVKTWSRHVPDGFLRFTHVFWIRNTIICCVWTSVWSVMDVWWFFHSWLRSGACLRYPVTAHDSSSSHTVVSRWTSCWLVSVTLIIFQIPLSITENVFFTGIEPQSSS